MAKDLPAHGKIPPGIGQADAVSTIEHPAAVYGDCDGLFRHVIQLGRQHPPARFAICRIEQSPHQKSGGPFALVGHDPTTLSVLKWLLGCILALQRDVGPGKTAREPLR